VPPQALAKELVVGPPEERAVFALALGSVYAIAFFPVARDPARRSGRT
jgi:hypothetical protein